MFLRITMLALVLLAGDAAAATCSEADAATLRELKITTWPGLYRTQDVAGLDALLLDGVRTVDAQGAVTTKADELDWLSKNAWTAQDFTYRIDSLECFGDTAVIIGEGSSRHGAKRSSYVSSNVFVKQDGRWRVAGSHLSASKDAPAD